MAMSERDPKEKVNILYRMKMDASERLGLPMELIDIPNNDGIIIIRETHARGDRLYSTDFRFTHSKFYARPEVVLWDYEEYKRKNQPPKGPWQNDPNGLDEDFTPPLRPKTK